MSESVRLWCSIGALLIQMAPLMGQGSNAPSPAPLPLPTQMSHYSDFDADTHARQAASALLLKQPQLLPLAQQISGTAQSSFSEQDLAKAEIVLRTLPWEDIRHDILEQLVHRSNVLELAGGEFQQWKPFVHDALIFFLDQLGRDHLLEKLKIQARVAGDASRGSRVLALASGAPVFQKIGQILARNPAIDADLRLSLQSLENSIRTTSRDDLVSFIEQDLGRDVLQRYRVEFAPEILAEASVGALIAASLVDPETSQPSAVVCKVIKAKAEKQIREELKAFDALGQYLDQNSRYYKLGDFPLSDMLGEIRDALAKEILVVQEQANLTRAVRYYRQNPRVTVPQVHSISTERVTVMDFVRGLKISDAFPDSPGKRAIMARRLASTLTYDVIFSRSDDSIFHGDPHAGNVYRVTNFEKDPYLIALLDWGLAGSFTVEERQDLVQILLGLQLQDRRRLRKHIRVLIRGGIPESQEGRESVYRVIDKAFDGDYGEETFAILQSVLTELAKQGHEVPINLALFIKSQLTISGILHELDPSLRQDRYIMSRLTGQVLKELPKRILLTLTIQGWNSRNFDSLLSNEDVKDVQARKMGKALGKLFRLPLRLFNP